MKYIFRNICLQECPEDGLHFDPDTLNLELTQVDAAYDGIRARLIGYLGNSRIPIQIDIGFSDAITPNPVVVNYPCYLPDLPCSKLNGYPPETVVAEKAHAIIRLGELNSRLKDFYDLWLLSENIDFDGAVLQQAIQATFQRRQTDYPTALPNALTPEFADQKQKEWERTVISKINLISGQEAHFAIVVERLRKFFIPPLQALAKNQSFPLWWKAGVDWH